MKLMTLLAYTFYLVCVPSSNVNLATKPANSSSLDIILTGSTPGDELIKYLLTIQPDTKVDFIRWDLTLSRVKNVQNTFVLNIIFGESQPNTLGFKGGGEKLSFEGTYTTSQSKIKTLNGEIYQLQSNQLPANISMVKLNDNLFHLLNPKNKLITGNGGWSYTLNRKQQVNINSTGLPALTTKLTLPIDTARQIIFDGRTPCLDFAKENNLTVAPDCFKLKWKLILNKDPNSLLPTTYSIKRTNSRERDIQGKWAIITGTSSNPNAITYQLDPDKPETSVSLLVGDENVLFFLNKANQLYVGNGDFSFTLNRKH